ncbi:MAG: cupin domain-containing protein [Candidatus Dactylopiibacterium sp.]|nr:cupin domain-containing protein [Candidatus Dactylopiibacterium sp.]
MQIRNYLEAPFEQKTIHDGEGLIRSRKLFGADDFASGLRYVARTELPPGASIGEHGHRDAREELYVILSGTGTFQLDGQTRRVGPGDILLTRAGSTHGLVNDGTETLDVFVVWAL